MDPVTTMDPAVAVAEVLARPSMLSLAYQPIVDTMRGEVAGYEVLARLPGSVGPTWWFNAAHEHGFGRELELMVLERVIQQLRYVPRHRFLSVNLSPDALGDVRVAPMVNAAGQRAQRLVVELTEQVPFADLDQLAAALTPLRELGVLVAIDDAGTDYEGLSQLSVLRPDIVKIHSRLVSGAAADPAKLALAELLGQYAGRLDAWLVATGLEERADLLALVEAGIPLAQGYLLGHPGVVMADLEPATVELVRDAVEAGRRGEAVSGMVASASPETATSPQVVVTGDNEPVAIVVPGGTPTVRTVPVSLAVNLAMPMVEVARRAMARPIEMRFDPVVVVDTAGALVGVFTIDELMLHLASLAEG